MTRGNQRELARAKAAKKQQQLQKSSGAAAKGANAGVSTDKRMERDADIMRKKQEKALAEKKAADDAQASTKKVIKIDPLKEL